MNPRTVVTRWPLNASIIALALLVALLVATISLVPAQTAVLAQPEQAPVQEERDIVYATHDGVELLGDLYSPRGGRGPFPAVLMVHGGGWRGGSRGAFTDLGRFLAQNGYVAFSVTYRLAPGEGQPSLETSTFPQNIWDLKAAVQYLRGEAEQLRIDPERLAATGGSAGGHLVAILGLTGGYEPFANPYDDEHADQPDNVDVVVPMAGIYDMVEQWERDVQRRPQSPITEWYLGGPFYDGEVRARYYESSPAYHASTQNASHTAWMVVWGTEDNVVTPEAQAVRFVEDLTRANATVQPLPLVGETHQSRIADPGGWDVAVPRVLAFLDQQLKD
ncbi:MAG: prolyl oligopeptidase family serine peptidase [Actinobacteria bacterium]|nr:prolyl oligopeptidase family serine peptidase [Actinomycetota bacterium]